MKAAILSAQAEADIRAALEFYLAEAPHVAEGFVSGLEKAAARIERQPGIGSPCYAHELDIPFLRHWSLSRFPYGLFYLEHDDHLVVIRMQRQLSPQAGPGTADGRRVERLLRAAKLKVGAACPPRRWLADNKPVGK